MGVPKFFRYISERYPCLSELVKEYQIPEFDNLYLDMNGIIHMCSHPDDGNPHFRISEEKIFKDIFHYIEVLFRMIHPQKLFFMAIDGVAPRAKMNQQRGRRFRSAKDATKQEEDAKRKGEKLPENARFDSNCITPGTVFMAKLHEQLKYFVVNKISSDPTWQKCKVILSGHETPGEGEHKIMDYIRYMRAQPGYDPNTRHCLYGLDADLIMLGLCTHEPHFSLLREEVKFGKKSTKRMSVPEEITFYLLHLSLMREYLELEFYQLKDQLKGFDYDFEKIIDDWVLMGFLVGNDFIPHLPNLHITNGALPILYKAYMDILPSLDGYINEGGSLNLERFEKFMEKLGNIDVENFEEIRDDLLYMETKTGRKWNAHTKVSTRNLEEWTADADDEIIPLQSLEPEKDKPRDSGLAALIKETEEMCIDSELDETDDISEENDAFINYKKDYYRSKLEYTNVTPEVMRAQAEGYVRAIQWNLNYYYNGCCSWSWFYPHHYAPYISDIKGFANLKIEFEMGRPFMPFEQLLAVLPAASKDLLPEAYHHLMVDDDSEIKEYYPEDFETDLNGKKQEWEAVVLVPFIDEKVLLEAMEKCKDELTPSEVRRNCHGPMLIYKYTKKDLGQYSAPEYFPAIPHNHTFVDTMNYDDVLIPKEKLVKGAYPGVKMDVYYPGFPTMKHLKYKGQLKPAKIKVFETPSRNENMIITIIPNEKFSGEMIPVDLLGTSVWVGWPHLVEAKVVAISNSKRKYVSMGGPNEYNVEERTGNMIGQFKKEIEGITDFYKKRWGIEVGETSVLVYVRVMIGRKYIFSSNGRLTLEKQFTDNTANYPLQSVVFDIAAYDSQNSTFKDVESIFPKGCMCFTLTNPYYGSQGVVQDSKEPLKNGRIKISISVLEEPDFSSVREMSASIIRSYKSLHSTASQLSISNFIFSKITGSIFITARNNEGGLKNVNIGLDLKFNKKNKETPGYTKKMGNTWFYTNQAVEMVRMYMEKYPEIFHYLYQDTNSDEINAESIFKDDWDEKLKELQTWLKQLPCHSVERQTCGTEIVEPDVIKEIESIVDKCTKSGKSKKVTMQIKPNFLYRPEIQDGTLMPDPKTETKIFDRIVNVRNGYTVPLGLKGTVVAIHKSADGSDRDVIYDVVFDKPFDGGMQLNCSENRGYKLPNTAVVNISYGTRLMEAKTGKPDELIARAEATHSQGNNHNNNKTPNHLYNSPPQQFFQMQPYQQPHPQQSWRQYQNPPQQYVPLQNHQPFQQENSAFAQFCSNNNLASRESFSDPPYNSPMQRQNYGSPFNQPISNTKIQSQTHSKQFRNGSSSSNGVVDRASFQFQKSDNMFMPSFGNRRQEDEQATSQSPEKRPNMHKNESFDLTQSSTGVTETDVQANISESSTAPKSPNKTMHHIIPGVRQQTENAAKSPASVRLLTYYQSNGLGLPRYQYFRNGDSIQSQLSLPTGETVVGKPAKNREEASENVAAETLEIFIKKAKGEADTTKQTGDFPSPPQTWVQPAKATTPNNKEQKPERQRTSSKTDTAVLNNSFVPLQAIKNHISKVNTNNKQLPGEGTLTENQDNKTSVSESDNKDYKNQSTSNQNSQKQRRERKTRIAANFVASKNQ